MRNFDVVHVKGTKVRIEDDYICLTDMANNSNDESKASDVVKNWMRAKSTVLFLGAWEKKNNKNFKVVEFDHFKIESGNNNFSISVSSWIEKTGSIGIYTKKGKFGGTFAHKDIAFEFGSAISAEFKLYLIEEFQRLKELELKGNGLDWGIRRYLSKANWHIQTDAVKKYMLPVSTLPKEKHFICYAQEGDILNLALFGFSSKTWRIHNPILASKGHNVREYASTNELAVLASLEGINAVMIKSAMPYNSRLATLKETAMEQLEVLNRQNIENSVRKNSDGQFQVYYKNDQLGMFPAKPDERLIGKVG